MLYFIYSVDKANSEDLRKATRGAHLAYAADFNIMFAGPTLSDDGEHMTGTVIVVDVADAAAAAAFVANDPYTMAGLFQSTVLRPWRKVIPAN